MTEILHLTLLALLGSVLALSGGLIFLYVRSWSSFLSHHSTPFAAGVLITISLVGLLPEAFETAGEQVFLFALVAFLSAFLFEHLWCDLHHHDHHSSKDGLKASSVPLIIVGDTIHNFIDGVAIAASFLVNPGLGLITALSTFLHEVPHEIGDFGILLKAGWKRANIIVVNFLSALTTVLGAWFVFYFVSGVETTGILLAIAAGIFLYLGASDFLPETSRHPKNTKKSVLMVLLGVLVMLATFSAIPHSHSHDEGSGEHSHLHDDEHGNEQSDHQVGETHGHEEGEQELNHEDDHLHDKEEHSDHSQDQDDIHLEDHD